jgi:very-short-patch-repair endonuclease
MPYKYWTDQEKLVQRCIEEAGLRYITQAYFGKYAVDFYLPELNVGIEADGPFGHLKKRDEKRDEDLKNQGLHDIIHFKENTLESIRTKLWQELNRLNQEL